MAVSKEGRGHDLQTKVILLFPLIFNIYLLLYTICFIMWTSLMTVANTDKISGQTKNWSFKHLKFTIIEYQHMLTAVSTILYPQLVIILQLYYLFAWWVVQREVNLDITWKLRIHLSWYRVVCKMVVVDLC